MDTGAYTSSVRTPLAPWRRILIALTGLAWLAGCVIAPLGVFSEQGFTGETVLTLLCVWLAVSLGGVALLTVLFDDGRNEGGGGA